MKKKILTAILISIIITSCNIYSFTGASIPEEAKTVSVEYIKSETANAPSSLNQTITEELKDRILGQTNLELTELTADLIFSGEIIKYEVKPMAIQANETAAQNRLTINLRIKYNNTLNKDQSFNNTFSRYRDFNSSENLADIELLLIEEITKELIEDIFNKAFVNW